MRDRCYYGDLYVVNGKCCSPYIKKKLALTKGYGFVRILEKKFDKAKVEVFYLDVPFATAPVNYVGTDIVELSDIRLFDWNLVKEIYATGFNTIVMNYMRYLEIFNTWSIGWLSRKSGIFKFAETNHTEDNALAIYDTIAFDDKANWMIDYVESGKIDLDAHIKQLKEKYKIPR